MYQIISYFCHFKNVYSKPPDLRSPDTLQKEVESKEKILAAELNITPIKLEKIEKPSPEDKKEEHYMPNKDLWQYTSDYMNQMTSLKKKHFISDESPNSDDEKLSSFQNLSDDDKKKAMIKSDYGHNILPANGNIEQSQLAMSKSANGIEQIEPKIVKISDLMNIPNLWNITAVDEGIQDNLTSNDIKINKNGTPDSGDWEMI